MLVTIPLIVIRHVVRIISVDYLEVMQLEQASLISMSDMGYIPLF
jgi:hypothetical protein